MATQVGGAATPLAAWRLAARQLLATETPPAQAHWSTHATQSLTFDDAAASKATRATKERTPHVVPRRFLTLAERVLCHSDPARCALLYEALWRMTHGEAHLFELAHDPLVRCLELYDRSIRRDIHKTHAFVRFQPVSEGAANEFMAWFEPHFAIVPLVGRFFVNRFTSMHWTLMTPFGCAAWDGTQLTYSAGIEKPDTNAADPVVDAWKLYYRSIFNPARLHLRAMKREMPLFYWKNMPETAAIAQLIEHAGARTTAMIEAPVAPRRRSVARVLAKPASTLQTDVSSEAPGIPPLRQCRLCPHAASATQAVAGEGSHHATIMLIGEQPGDLEDLHGRVFVGPAGKVLDEALAAAGMHRRELYLTNAVKHFDWQLRGKRRVHKTPSQQAIERCRVHLLDELDRIQPKVIVCLGRTAATSMTQGTGLELQRGVPERLPNQRYLLHTFHPAAVLRRGADAVATLAQLTTDLGTARDLARDAAGAFLAATPA